MKTRIIVAAVLLLPFALCVESIAQVSEPTPIPSPSGVSGMVSGLWSVQPSNPRFERGPYLDGTLGGGVLGVGASLSVPVFKGARTAMIVVPELSTTLALSGTLGGRLFRQPRHAEHRDTVISVLPGIRLMNGEATIDLIGGGSLVLGLSSFDNESFDGDLITPAVTGGIDVEIPMNTRFGIVTVLRYTHVVRGDRNIYLGLGNHILRGGIGLRIR